VIITLCGSSRFEPWFRVWNTALGLAGHVPLGLCGYPSEFDGQKEWYDTAQKAMLDSVHRTKIMMSDAVLVLNVFAYIGESTLREIEQAQGQKKELYFLESWGEGCGIGPMHASALRNAAWRFNVPNHASPIDTSKYRDVWASELLGPGGKYRSSILTIINQRLGTLDRLRGPSSFSHA
jgi:hypothetical protein